MTRTAPRHRDAPHGRRQRGDGLHRAVQAEAERTTGRYAATEECPAATAELPGHSSVDDLLNV
jgi:hypothetical protein